MRSTVLVMMIFASVGLQACGSVTRDFCAVSEPIRPRDEAVAIYLFDNDRDMVKKLQAHNEYGETKCNWTIGN